MNRMADPAAQRKLIIEFYNTPGPPAGVSEDCLSINVYAPAGPGENRTVMFWIYGGSLQFGSNSVGYYDGTSFAATQDVVVVVPNYRTNGTYEFDLFLPSSLPFWPRMEIHVTFQCLVFPCRLSCL